MARLPSAIDLQRRPAPSETPNIRVGQIDYSPAIYGDRAIGAGVEQVGRGFEILGQAQTEIEDYATRKKLLDFKLKSEMAQEDMLRQMPLGGDGYPAAWEKTYRKLATDFVGRDDANIAPSQRAKVGLLLKQHESSLMERAQREANKEKDRYTVQGLEETVAQYRSRVEADPSKHDDVQRELVGLINTSPLTPAMRHAYQKKVRETVSEAAASSVADSVTDRASYERAKELLAPHRPDKITVRDVRTGILSANEQGQIDPAAFATRMREKVANSGLAGTVPSWGRQFGIATGSADEWARFFTMVQQQESGHRTARVRPDGSLERFPTTPSGEKSFGPGQFNVGEYGLKTWADVNDPERVMDAYIEVAKQGKIQQYFGSVQRPNETLQHAGWFDRMVKPKMDSAEPSPDQPEGDAYNGPFANLPLAKRRAIMAKADQAWQKQIAGVERVIKEQMSVAGDGYVPPKPVLDVLEKQVFALGDPMVAAQYESMLAKAQVTQRLHKAPPLAIEEYGRSLRDDAAAKGVTKEQDDAIRHVEKVAAAVRKNVNDNALSWAHRTGIEVPLADGPPDDLDPGQRGKWQMPTGQVQLEQLDFSAADIDAKLLRRAEQAKGVGRYYSQPPQLFTANEREFLRDALRDGGPRMLDVFGKIAKAATAAGIDPSRATSEVTKDPEVAMIGMLVAERANPGLLDDAAKSLHLRKQEGDKFISHIDRAQTKPDISDLMPVLRGTPGMTDPVIRLANSVYEYRHRRRGLTAFDADVYKETVREILGETKVNDVAYGGPGRQGAGWFDSKWASPVIVPAGVRQDSFDALVAQLRDEDLELTGQPLGRERRPLSLAKIKSATWVSVGNARYGLQFDTEADGTAVMALDKSGAPFVLDLNPVMERLRKRKPDIFAGAR